MSVCVCVYSANAYHCVECRNFSEHTCTSRLRATYESYAYKLFEDNVRIFINNIMNTCTHTNTNTNTNTHTQLLKYAAFTALFIYR